MNNPTETPQTYARMVDYLRKLYDFPLYERFGVKHPLIVFPAPPEQVTQVDSVLGQLHSDKTPTYAFYNHAHLHTLQNSGRRVYNAPTYDLRRLHERPLRLDASIGSYFDMLATCGALEAEIKDAVQGNLIRLPQRSTLHTQLPAHRSVWDGRGRASTIGVLTVIVFPHQGQWVMMLAQRTPSAAVDAGRYHVLPAFILQPMTNAQTDWRLSYHVYREWLEELFAVPESFAESGGDLMQQPAYQDLHAMMNAGQAQLLLMGVVFNLLTLRAEIATLLWIRDESWYNRITQPDSHIRLNATAEARGGRVALVPVGGDDADLRQVLGEPPYLHIATQAIGGIGLSMDWVRQHG